MQEVTVTKAFRDKDSAELHKEGDVVKFPNERAAELSEKGYVKYDGEPTKKVVEQPENKAQDMSMDRVKKPNNKAEKKFSTKTPEEPKAK